MENVITALAYNLFLIKIKVFKRTIWLFAKWPEGQKDAVQSTVHKKGTVVHWH